METSYETFVVFFALLFLWANSGVGSTILTRSQPILPGMCSSSHFAKSFHEIMRFAHLFRYSYFIEAIFHFNEYTGHQSYNKFVVTDRERKLFSLVGPANKQQRMKLYKFMLENMNDESR